LVLPGANGRFYLRMPFYRRRMRSRWSLLALTTGLVVGNLTTASAQAAPAAAAGWYVAAEAACHRFAQPETVHTEGTTSPYLLLPAQVLIGRRFSSGLGVEAGFMYHQREAPATSAPQYPDPSHFYYYSNEAVQAFAATLLLRAPLLHPAARSRWQLDGKMGLTYLDGHFTEKFYSGWALAPDPPAPDRERRRRLGDLPITLGLGASYRLGSHLQLTADASAHVSWVLCIAKLFGTSGSPVGGGGGIGLRYTL
jgi:hypothetical protein